MHQECIHVQYELHIWEPVNKHNFLIQILMNNCIKLYMQEVESDPKKNITDHD